MTRAERDRFDLLAPRDLAITLRSLRRRLGRVEVRATAPELTDLLEQTGPDGHRLDELLAEGARSASFTTNVLDRSLDTTTPVVPAEVFDPAARSFVDERPMEIGAAIGAIADEADDAAERVERASAGELSRSVSLTGGGDTTPLAVGQQAAREMIGVLDRAIRHVEWLEDQV